MTEEIKLTTEVLNCDYFNRNRGFNCYKGKNCTEVPDCYFRQLKCLEQENRELKAYKDVNEDFKKAWDELNEKYTEVLKLAKENADSNEYCLQELEQENKELKELFEKRGELMCNCAKQRENYRSALEEIRENLVKLKTNDEDDFTYEYSKIEDKINEVLDNEYNG